jgi:hypothetical protein
LTVTVTSTTTSKSGGVAPAAVGGIAAGIVGGFLLLGALLGFILLRKPNTVQNDSNPHPSEETNYESKHRASGNINFDPHA